MTIIGLDIGGTKVRGILWDGKRVMRSHEFRTPKSEADLRARLVALTGSLASRNPLRAVGVGAAGIVDKTTLTFSPNIPFVKDLDFRSLWPRSVALKVDNDARCFARAEFLRGAGRGCKSLFVLTIGTGVGRSYGKNGKIIKIKRFEYPEWWERRYQAVRNTGIDRKLASFLGEKLSPLIMPFRPEVVVVGGGVLKRGEFLAKLRAEFKAHGLMCKIRRATLERNAAAIGAALLFDK